jgi:hypothetical protein
VLRVRIPHETDTLKLAIILEFEQEPWNAPEIDGDINRQCSRTKRGAPYRSDRDKKALELIIHCKTAKSHSAREIPSTTTKSGS